MEREVVRQKMQIKWKRVFKESWCWIMRGRVSVVTLPCLSPILYAKAATGS